MSSFYYALLAQWLEPATYNRQTGVQLSERAPSQIYIFERGKKMYQELDRYIKSKAAFDLSDPFGKGRIRKLIYEYEQLRHKCKKEIESLRNTVTSQANSVTMMVGKLNSLEKEKAYLENYIRESDATKVNLQNRRIDADKKAEELIAENAKLKGELSILREDYRQLYDMHEALLETIRKERPDIDLDRIAS